MIRGAARTNHRSEVFNTPSRKAKTQPDGWAVAWWVWQGIMERFFRKRGRVGVIMAYREWGGCCRNPGGVPSAGLRRDRSRGCALGGSAEKRGTWSKLAERGSHEPPIGAFLTPPSAKQKPSQTAGLLLGGRGWIRTTEVVDNRFTVCSLWPLGNPSVCAPPRFTPGTRWMELVNGIEPSTC